MVRDAFLICPDGSSVRLADRSVIGQSRDSDIVIHSSTVGRRHAVLLRLPSGAVEAEDLATTNGTRLNGEPLDHAVLAHGDELEIDGRRYRFELGPERPAPVELFPAALGGDPAAAKVWGDALVEQGHPLGPVLAAGQPLPLVPLLQGAVDQGTLELEWRGSFVHAARLRRHPFHEQRALLFALLRADATRFLTELSLPDLQARHGLEQAPLPVLRVLRFGPFFSDEDEARCRRALATARFDAAPLVDTFEVQRFTRAWLEFDAHQRRELNQGQQATFPTCAVRWEPGGWLVMCARGTRSLQWNGRARFSAVLAPGDVVSSASTRFVFSAQ